MQQTKTNVKKMGFEKFTAGDMGSGNGNKDGGKEGAPVRATFKQELTA